MSTEDYKSETEESLLLSVKDGDRSAFDELYTRHWTVVYGMAYNILRDHQYSKDIVQDIFVWFWEHRGQWNLTTCRGYLLTAVKFKTANFIRASKIREDFFKSAAQREQMNYDQNLMLEVKELEQFIHTVISDLPDRCRQIFTLSRFKHCSNKEIAAELNISEKTVEMQITIALKKLREKLGNGHVLLYFFI
ncbi:RNA polymerase sigma-70 factor [Pedobacter sp. KBW06]|uniref:RNA polymerase sigma-70 factor n=1 Tax=Pedobacter sp. KBW06 TaxID=2153359 RepID=UPI000F5AEE09|nr:RNA polymerase sigma-70 factor [Pedobacter sp. KBW06]RQO74466.1 RNA polymerase sigma-70 factor [Pedobacter sp. KBW06]